MVVLIAVFWLAGGGGFAFDGPASFVEPTTGIEFVLVPGGTFFMGSDADDAKVSAELKDGVLAITVPKAEPKAAGAKKVAIKKG